MSAAPLEQRKATCAASARSPTLKLKLRRSRLPWSAEEDEALRSLVTELGMNNWNDIAAGMPGRSSKSCSLRWRCYLDPTVTHPAEAPFSEWETAVIFLAQSALGNKWTDIARLVNGRSNSAVKNHWNVQSKELFASGTLNNSFLDAGLSLEELLAMEEPLRYGQQTFVAPLGATPWKRQQLLGPPAAQGEVELPQDDATQLLLEVSPVAAAAAGFVSATAAAPSCSGSPQHSLALSRGSAHRVHTGASPAVVTGVRSVAPAAARKTKGLVSAGSLSSLHSARTVMVMESAGSGSPVGPVQTVAAVAAVAATDLQGEEAHPAAVGAPFRARIRMGGRLLGRREAQRELRRLQAAMGAGVAGASSRGGGAGGGSSSELPASRGSSRYLANQQAAHHQQYQGGQAGIHVPNLLEDPFEALLSGLDDPLGCSYSCISGSPMPGSGSGGLCGSHSSATSLSVLELPEEGWMDPWDRLEDPGWDILAQAGLVGTCNGPPPWPALPEPVNSLSLCDDLALPGLPVVKAEPLAVPSPASPLLTGEGWDLDAALEGELPLVPTWVDAGGDLPMSPPATSTAGSCQVVVEPPAAEVAGSWLVPSAPPGDKGSEAAAAPCKGMGSKQDAGSSSSLQHCAALQLTGSMSRQGSCSTPQAISAAAGPGVALRAGGLADTGARVVNVSLAVKRSSPVKPANTAAGHGAVTSLAAGTTAGRVPYDVTAAPAAPAGRGGILPLPDLATAKEKLSKLPYDKLLAVAARVAAAATAGQPVIVNADMLDGLGAVDRPTMAAGGSSSMLNVSIGCKRPGREELVGPDRWQQQCSAQLVTLPGSE